MLHSGTVISHQTQLHNFINKSTTFTRCKTVKDSVIHVHGSVDLPYKEQVEQHHPSHNCLLWWVLLVAAVAASLSCGPQSADITWWVEGEGEGAWDS